MEHERCFQQFNFLSSIPNTGVGSTQLEGAVQNPGVVRWVAGSFTRSTLPQFMVLILSDLLLKNYGRLCQKKSEGPNHWKYLKEIFSPSKLRTAAANCARTLFKCRFFVISTFCNLYILYSWP